MPAPIKSIQYRQVTQDQAGIQTGEAIVEMPVSLTVNGETWLTLICTPVDLEALAAGFLFNEGILTRKDEIADIRPCPAMDNVDIWLNHSGSQPERWRRTSGCTGGMTSVDATRFFDLDRPPLFNGCVLAPEQISHLVAQLFEAQELYRQSGGVHTSALSDGETLWVVAEDVGRHNTLDKIAGHMLLDDLHPASRMILTTGRVSSEMLQKTARMGAAVIVSRTAPTSLSIELAEKWGITLVGYARRRRFNIYTHPERILVDTAR